MLRKAAVKAYPGSKIVTLVPELGRGGQSLSITPMAQEELKIKRLEADFYVLEGTPADAVYVGLGTPDRFVRDQFDLVLTGVNHGQNVGMDVFHSGTVGMAMLASAFFGVRAIAFSQEIEYGQAKARGNNKFYTAGKHLAAILEDMPREKIYCRTVNFPLQREPKGRRVCGISMFSRFRPHLALENKREDQDVAQLEQGYITISVLDPPMLGLADRGPVRRRFASCLRQSVPPDNA